MWLGAAGAAYAGIQADSNDYVHEVRSVIFQVIIQGAASKKKPLTAELQFLRK